MRKRINFRDHMEALAADENALQGYVQEYGDNLVADFLQAPGSRGYAGLAVTRKSSTVVTVAIGRYYDGAGRMYGLDAAVDIDLTPYLPAVSPKIVAVVCYGEEVAANSVVRDYVDPVTEEAVPNQIYLEAHRRVALTVVAGAEAGTPVAPSINAIYLGVAYVLLATTGIADQASITQITANEISSLDDAFGRVESLEEWKRGISTSLTSLRSDIADLARLVEGMASTTAITTIAREMARMREEIGLPDTYSIAHADAFLTDDEADTTHASWLAKIAEGIRFADANAAEAPLALLSSIDSAVKVSTGGLMLPKYTEQISLSIGDRASERDGELPMAQYQTATINGNVITLSRLRQRYGEEFLVCTNSRYWQTGEYDAATGVFKRDGEIWDVNGNTQMNHQAIRLTRWFEDYWRDAYWSNGRVAKSITGKILAQTRLASDTRWVTGIDLWFSRVGAAGDVTVLCMEVVDGRIAFDRILAHVTLPAASLKKGAWTTFPLEPFVRRKGGRYATVVVTAGDHWLMHSANNDYTQGTLFTFVDGDFAVALANKDLCFQERVAKFASTQTVVDLQPWNLDGGIAGVDVMVPSWRSASAGFAFQFRIGGAWHTIGEVEGATPFVGLPALVPARLVMTHTQEIAPGLRFDTSRVRLTRPRTTGTFVSKPWSTPAATEVTMTVLLSAFDEAHHTCVPKLLHGAGAGTLVAASSVSIATRSDGLKVMTAVFSGLPSIVTYRWRFDFTTTSALLPFVIEEVQDAAL